MHGKAITVLEMDYPIVDFMALCETPYNNGEDTHTHTQTGIGKTHIISELHGRLRRRLVLPVKQKCCKHFSLHVGLCLIKYGLGMTVCSLSVCVTEVQEPYAVVVLLEKDLIVVDLTQSK